MRGPAGALYAASVKNREVPSDGTFVLWPSRPPAHPHADSSLAGPSSGPRDLDLAFDSHFGALRRVVAAGRARCQVCGL